MLVLKQIVEPGTFPILDQPDIHTLETIDFSFRLLLFHTTVIAKADLNYQSFLIAINPSV